MRTLYTVVFLFLFIIQIASAQSDDSVFNIRVSSGQDTEAPTTPVLLTIDPVAPTQIDLVWSAATDNTSVSGYSIIRDGSPIATTTQLTYSDTGLIASTTYSYIVKAFDLLLNYSSSSNSLSTTTPEYPPIVVASSTPTNDTSAGTVARVVVDDFQIKTGVSTSSINLKTTRPSRIELRWGRSASYELGYVINNAYSRTHDVLLTDLEPGTTYEYEIIGYTPYGKSQVIKVGRFITDSIVEIGNVPNVSGFYARQNENDVLLEWKKPSGEDISYVRIVRSHLGFPEYPQAGKVVYQGLSDSALDRGVLSDYSPIYYTAFVYDRLGNVSSGAVAIVYREGGYYQGHTNDVQTDDGGSFITEIEPVFLSEEATSSIDIERITPEMKMPRLYEIEIIQEDREYTFFDKDIILQTDQEFVLSIPRRFVAGNLKSIIATIVNPTNNRRTDLYLLRINKDQTAYEAVVVAPSAIGRSQIKIEIYDYEVFVVGTYQAPILFVSVSDDESKEDPIFPDKIYPKVATFLGLSLIVLVLFFIILFVKRRTEDNW